MTDTIDFIGEIHTWLARYDSLTATHVERLSEFQNDEGREGYSDTRLTNALESDDFLDRLVAHLRELAGPPVPGTPFTLTFAGPERHDGEQPYSFIANGADLNDAGFTLLHLPFFREWFAEQAGWDDGTPPDVLYIPGQSHPGLPEWGVYNDLRREQAAFLAAAEQPAPAPADAPALPPAPPLALLG